MQIVEEKSTNKVLRNLSNVREKLSNSKQSFQIRTNFRTKEIVKFRNSKINLLIFLFYFDFKENCPIFKNIFLIMEKTFKFFRKFTNFSKIN